MKLISRKSYKNIEQPIEFINEVWMPISKLVHPNILPYYFVSNYGRIYSQASGRILHPAVDKDGYLFVTLHIFGNNIASRNTKYGQITRRVNRIVLLSFVPVSNYKNLIVHHINHVRYDNRLLNLIWVTAYENSQYSYECGYRRFVDVAGESNPMAILSNDDVIKIKDMIRSKQYTFKQIANIYNISESVIGNIAANKTWNNVGGEILKTDILATTVVTEEEFYNICRWFEENDINNRTLYPSMNKLIATCWNELALNQKYGDIENKRKFMVNVLRKNSRKHDVITSKFNYKYDY